MTIAKKQEQLLGWYDRHQRVMPWRARKGKRPNPYHVWLSEIMLQQTTVAAVGPYFMKFVQKWPTVEKLAKAKLDDVLAAWAGLGYYARARNLHKCAQTVTQKHGNQFPETEKELIELPGIGPYTAAAVSSIAFNHEAVAVDGNVERVVARFFGIKEPLPLSKEKIRKKAAELAKNNPRPSDFTQAFMELGATVCTPKNPKCALCPWNKDCTAQKQRIAETLPARAAKKQKPVKYGKVFWISGKNRSFLIEKRKNNGLYAGMYQLPTTEWISDKKAAKNLPSPSSLTHLKSLDVTVRHSFTHFDLVLDIWSGTSKKAVHGTWITLENIGEYALPSLMKKAIRLCAKK